MEEVNLKIEEKMSIAGERIRLYSFPSVAVEETPLFLFRSVLTNEITGEELRSVTSVSDFRFITIPFGTLQTHIVGRFPSSTSLHPEKDLMREFGEFRHQIMTN